MLQLLCQQDKRLNFGKEIFTLLAHNIWISSEISWARALWFMINWPAIGISSTSTENAAWILTNSINASFFNTTVFIRTTTN